MLRWGDADPAATLNSLLGALGRLLQPSLGDSAAIFVGPALLLLLQKMPAAVQPVIPQVCSSSEANSSCLESPALL